MSTLASTLLDFILDLFRDPAKAAAYEADPQGALDAAGLSDSTPADVADLAPMVSDYATVGGWSGGNSHGGSHGGGSHGGRDDHHHGGGGRGGSCDADEDRGGHHHPRPVDHHEDEHSSGGGVAPVDRDECDDDEDEGQAGGGHSHAPAPAGGTETVVITHLQEVHYSHTETTVEIDASHSIWVSGDAQAIFGDVRGDVTQIDNEGGIVAGDDVEDSSVDNSDNSVSDSNNTDVSVDVDDSPINIGGEQAVDSFNGNEDNDVIADRGGQVGDNTSVRLDDVTVVQDSEDVGNTTTVTDSFNEDASTETDVDVDVRDSFNDNSDNSTNTDVDVRDSFNDDSTNYDVDVDDSFNEDASTTTEVDADVDVRDSFNDNSDNSTEVEDSFNDNSDSSTNTEVDVDVEQDYDVDAHHVGDLAVG